MELEKIIEGIKSGDRSVLGRALTLVESSAPQHISQAQTLLSELMPLTGDSIRIGITGIPGSGKSTLIEALGLHIIKQGHKVAVLAVDPSSSISGGSILGDKTRMVELARNPGSFIRPSPAGGKLGGVARKTRESILICEAAGYDVIIVETVGVGQSEIAVREMVDFFLLLQIVGGGDELQSMKKGVLELADAIFINKADGDNKVRAEAAQRDLKMAVHYFRSNTPGWKIQVGTCSALTGTGVCEIWQTVEEFKDVTSQNEVFSERRTLQAKNWLHAFINEHLNERFKNHPGVRERLPQLEAAVVAGKMPAMSAADELVKLFLKDKL